MTTIQSLTAVATNIQPQTLQPEPKQSDPTVAKPAVPTVQVSSSATSVFSGLADLILGSKPGGQDTGATAAPQGKSDGDGDSGSGVVNDGDADDAQMGAGLQFADSGTYNFGGATA